VRVLWGLRADVSLRWLPWSWIVRHAARSFGFFDPALFLARLRKFGQPSEYDVPLEIVRNAVMFHSRGLINTRAIQNNLDWVWPYWIERQFDPQDVSFLPRSANFSHINLTHRNWTAVGLPDLAVYPLVDPRGLVIPLFDGWSIDAWVVVSEEQALVPSRLMHVDQWLATERQVVVTVSERDGLRLKASAELNLVNGLPVLQLNYSAESEFDADLVVAVRPYNVEGIQFVDTIDVLPDQGGWIVNGKQEIHFAKKPGRFTHANYAEGDVFHRLKSARSGAASCPVHGDGGGLFSGKKRWRRNDRRDASARAGGAKAARAWLAVDHVGRGSRRPCQSLDPRSPFSGCPKSVTARVGEFRQLQPFPALLLSDIGAGRVRGGRAVGVEEQELQAGVRSDLIDLSLQLIRPEVGRVGGLHRGEQTHGVADVLRRLVEGALPQIAEYERSDDRGRHEHECRVAEVQLPEKRTTHVRGVCTGYAVSRLRAKR
jgi:hypothetical protein